MDSSSQLTIAYDMLYYVKLAALSITTICRSCRTLTLFVFRYQQFSEGRYILFFDLI